jgi:hypothetical protein
MKTERNYETTFFLLDNNFMVFKFTLPTCLLISAYFLPQNPSTEMLSWLTITREKLKQQKQSIQAQPQS